MRVLIVRLDAIGDAILWCGAAAGIRDAYPGATIAVACRPAAAPIHATCPDVDVVFPVDPRAVGRDDVALHAAAVRLDAWEPDVVLHPVRSRERHAERLVAALGTREKIALASDTANCTPAERAAFDAVYTTIVPSPDADRHELERHADFLAGIGAAVPRDLRPRVWTTAADRAAADRRLADLDVNPTRTIAFFPTARWRYKLYPAWGAVLAATASAGDTVLLLGGDDGGPTASALTDELARDAPHVRLVNACGETTLRETIALIARCGLCLGLDTFAMHAAIAVGTPSVAVAGGGHPGRFLPYDPTNAIACRPLACQGCDWRCRYDRTHCIEDVPPAAIVAAIRSTRTGPPAPRPRVFLPVETGPQTGPQTGPAAAVLPGRLVSRVEIHRVPIADRGDDLQVLPDTMQCDRSPRTSASGR